MKDATALSQDQEASTLAEQDEDLSLPAGPRTRPERIPSETSQQDQGQRGWQRRVLGWSQRAPVRAATVAVLLIVATVLLGLWVNQSGASAVSLADRTEGNTAEQQQNAGDRQRSPAQKKDPEKTSATKSNTRAAADNSATTSPEKPANETKLWVHVVGQVNSPGVFQLAAGSRVTDAVTKAGGAGAQADLSGLNLARLLEDGEQIRVPTAEEAALAVPTAQGTDPQQPGGENSGDPGRSTDGQPINLNQASSEQLQQLPRIGPAIAQRILEWKSQNGPFEQIDQLLEVSGIGEKTLAGFRDLIRL